MPAATIPREPTKNWRVREHMRILTGMYTCLPDKVLAVIPPRSDGFTDYVHLSLTNAGMVAYTPDETKGEADIQVSSRFGSYLKKTRGSVMSDRDISALVEREFPGAAWRVGSNGYAAIYRRTGGELSDDSVPHYEASGDTAALGLCAAFLRAKAEGAP